MAGFFDDLTDKLTAQRPGGSNLLSEGLLTVGPMLMSMGLGQSAPPGLMMMGAGQVARNRQDYRNEQNFLANKAFRERQLGLLEDKARRDQRQAEQRQAFLQSLPEADRPAAMFNPDAFLKDYYRRQENQRLMETIGNMGGTPEQQRLAAGLIQAGKPGEAMKVFATEDDGLDVNQIIQRERDLYKDFQAETQNLRDQIGAYRRTEAIYQDPTQSGARVLKVGDKVFEPKSAQAAADLALIFNYMKLLDPRSVVRESEFELAASAGNAADRAEAYLSAIAVGGKLSENMRRELVKQSRNQFDAANRAMQEKFESAMGRAQQYQQYGLDPARAISYTPYQPFLERSLFSTQPTTPQPVPVATPTEQTGEMNDDERRAWITRNPFPMGFDD